MNHSYVLYCTTTGKIEFDLVIPAREEFAVKRIHFLIQGFWLSLYFNKNRSCENPYMWPRGCIPQRCQSLSSLVVEYSLQNLEAYLGIFCKRNTLCNQENIGKFFSKQESLSLCEHLSCVPNLVWKKGLSKITKLSKKDNIYCYKTAFLILCSFSQIKRIFLLKRQENSSSKRQENSSLWDNFFSYCLHLRKFFSNLENTFQKGLFCNVLWWATLYETIVTANRDHWKLVSTSLEGYLSSNLG